MKIRVSFLFFLWILPQYSHIFFHNTFMTSKLSYPQFFILNYNLIIDYFL